MNTSGRQGTSPMPGRPASAGPRSSLKGTAKDVEWIVTTRTVPWQVREGLVAEAHADPADVMVQTESPRQTIEGFGACFNELGWTAFSSLGSEERDGIFGELFAPEVGANFTLCRMPVGANDFSRDWYSYDEAPGDFALEHLSKELKTPDFASWACGAISVQGAVFEDDAEMQFRGSRADLT